MPNDFDPWAGVLSDFSERAGGLTGDNYHAYHDLSHFSRHVMGYENPEYREPSQFIERIYSTLQEENDDPILILGPRNSAKSQAATVNYPLWRLGRNPTKRFLLVFAAKEVQGYKFSQQIASVIERNGRYREVFGDLTPKNKETWSMERRTVDRREPPGGIAGASLTFAGFGSNLPSLRADEIIIDDIVTQENAYSQTLQDQIENFVFSTLLPVLEPGGRLIVLGTRWDESDLYSRLLSKWRLALPEKDPRVNLDAILETSLA